MSRNDISSRGMALLELTPTGRVILGMIAFGRRTGYDIKQLVDKSTRHFWAASYGQIYPELRRLEQHGLVRSRSEPSGGRARTVYELTWEMRDEGMLKLFFSDYVPVERRLELIRAMRALQERKRAQLCQLDTNSPEMRPGQRLTLELGLGLTGWLIDWCEETERSLATEMNDAVQNEV